MLDHNRQQSEKFLSPDEVARREHYNHTHKTSIAALKCMDGRINVPPMTDDEVPMGIVSPFRNMGGKFKIGSPNFAPFVRNFFSYVDRHMLTENSPGGIVLVTYHYSAGSRERGCKGFNDDTQAARAYTASLKQDFEKVYGRGHHVIHPIHMGVETDSGAFILHGDAGDEVLNMAEALDWSDVKLQARLAELYPNMREAMLLDLMPFVRGNQRHVRKVIAANRPPVEMEHGENIIAVGRGFDWLHLVNRALIVGPFSVDWLSEVVVAGTIVLENLEKGRVNPDDGAVLLVSAPYRDPGVDAAVAREKALEMGRLSWETITKHPQISKLLHYGLKIVVGTLDRRTMLFNRIDPLPFMRAEHAGVSQADTAA